MKPWWLGICLWTLPHPHGSQFSFVIGRDRIESGESHLAFKSLERIIHDLVVWPSQVKLSRSHTFKRDNLTISYRFASKSIIVNSSSTKSMISPPSHSTFSILIVTSPAYFLRIFTTQRMLRSTTETNVHYDVQLHARWIIMSEFYERTEQCQGQKSRSRELIFMYCNKCM